MASLQDFQQRIGILNDQIDHQLPGLVQNYADATRATEDTLNSVQTLKKELGSLESQLDDADTSAATYDREFLERKGQQGEFVKNKLYTTQDFTIFFFFVSYIIFALAIALTYQKKVQILSAFFVLGIMITAVLLRYG